MKTGLALLLCYFMASASAGWETDFEKAKQLAEKEHKLILLNFSGSDWCGPCIRMHDEIFENEIFKSYSKDHLVLLNADFPRLKKNQLSREQQKHNDALADRYNAKGIFPLTVLLTTDGNVLKVWEGHPGIRADEFVSQLKTVNNAGR